MIGLNNAALTILSQQKGKGSEVGLRRYLNAFVVLLTGMSIVLGGVGFVFAEPILLFLERQRRWWIWPFPICKSILSEFVFFGYNFIGTVFRSVGDFEITALFCADCSSFKCRARSDFYYSFRMGSRGCSLCNVFHKVGFSIGIILFPIRKSSSSVF